MVEIVPGFKYRQIGTNYSNISWDYSLGLVLHVATGGNNSLFGWFSNPAASASSHWWAGYNAGEREQYLDPMTQMGWAQANGNSEYHSVETAGEPSAPLTEAQCEAVADIYAWGHAKFGWPFQLAEVPGQRGLGWHGMGGSSWGGHPYCPGELRKAQRQHILDLAQGIKTTSAAPVITEDQILMEDPVYILTCANRGIRVIYGGEYYQLPSDEYVNVVNGKIGGSWARYVTCNEREWDILTAVLTSGEVPASVDTAPILTAIKESAKNQGVSDESIQKIVDAVAKVDATAVAANLEVGVKK